MNPKPYDTRTTRRQLLQRAALLAGGAAVARLAPEALVGRARAAAFPWPLPQGNAQADPVAQMRQQMAAAPLEVTVIGPHLRLLAGPGGNMVVLDGPDGKVLVDSSVQGVAPRILRELAGMGASPLRFLINTHWHFDHTDGNADLHNAGATIVAHENTRRRLSSPQTIAAFGMTFPAAPPAGLPEQTFAESFALHLNGEDIAVRYIPPAHTDTDVYVHYQNANVVHLGDTFFNGIYPFIDGSTGGSINGMINAANAALQRVDASTRIVPGHGPMGGRAELTRFRDMLVAVRDKVQTLKSQGRSLQETVAAKPSAEFDAAWGGGFLQPDNFVTIVYNTL